MTLRIPATGTIPIDQTIAEMLSGSPAGPRHRSFVEDSEPAEFSDDALALRFAERYGNDLRYTAAWGRWSVWDGCLWKQDTTYAVLDLARIFCRGESELCQSSNLAARITSATTIAAVERLARTDRRHAATVDQWDVDPWLLNTPDGVVDLVTGRLRSAAREDYLTKSTTVPPSGDCPEWSKFLARITNGNSELQDYIRRMCGYLLTGLTREHALFFLYGTGANGKSVFLNTVAGAMGDYAKTAPAEAFMESKNERHSTDIAGLRGARLVTAQETEDGRRWAEAKLKMLTGGDRIAARFMRQDNFEYLPQFKLVFAGNHKPGLGTVDEAMRRRINMLPFTVTVPESERDPELTEKLRAEWPGILKWMIDGCLAWQSCGLLAPDLVVKATVNYLASEDRQLMWIQDNCYLEPNAWESSTILYKDFQCWALANGERSESQKSFAESLGVRVGISAERKSSGRGFRGIRLRKSK